MGRNAKLKKKAIIDANFNRLVSTAKDAGLSFIGAGEYAGDAVYVFEEAGPEGATLCISVATFNRAYRDTDGQAWLKTMFDYISRQGGNGNVETEGNTDKEEDRTQAV